MLNIVIGTDVDIRSNAFRSWDSNWADVLSPFTTKTAEGQEHTGEVGQDVIPLEFHATIGYVRVTGASFGLPIAAAPVTDF